MNAEHWMQVGATVGIQTFVVLGGGLLGARLLRRRGPLARMLALRGALLGVALGVLASLFAAATTVPTRALVKVSLPAPSSLPQFLRTQLWQRETPKNQSAQDGSAQDDLTGQKAIPSPQAETNIAVATSTRADWQEKTAASGDAPPTWERVYRSLAIAWLVGAILGLSWLALCAARLARMRRMSTHQVLIKYSCGALTRRVVVAIIGRVHQRKDICQLLICLVCKPSITRRWNSSTTRWATRFASSTPSAAAKSKNANRKSKRRKNASAARHKTIPEIDDFRLTIDELTQHIRQSSFNNRQFVWRGSSAG